MAKLIQDMAHPSHYLLVDFGDGVASSTFKNPTYTYHDNDVFFGDFNATGRAGVQQSPTR